MAQDEVLEIIKKYPGLTAGEIAEKIDDSYASVLMSLSRMRKNKKVQFTIKNPCRYYYDDEIDRKKGVI